MTEEVPVASTMPECNGSVPPEKGPLPVIAVIDEIAKSVGTVPYVNAETSPDIPLVEENQEENITSLEEDIDHGNLDGEKQCEGKFQHYIESAHDGDTKVMLSPSSPHSLCVAAGPGSEGRPVGPREPELETPGSPDEEAAGTLTASADGRGNAVEEEEVEEEEEDTEEDEVQVIDMKKENGEVSCRKQQDSSKEMSALTSPVCNSPVEKLGEQPSLGKKNDISRHSYSRYNTISYRRIRKGNTKQRIDEFESMMHL
ncbi:ERMIN protein, partial [Crotophaga sulcirostris]|nr:ERMIN protein [Crotophaga sulcirostris]